jgi:ABC-type microcin C transport system duplicated ATPase subunit YejF
MEVTGMDGKTTAPRNDPAPLLAVRDLHVSFESRHQPRRHAVRGISFDVPAGETVGLVGESGSGKSVTALSILGLLPERGCRRQGRILWRERDLLPLRDRDLRAVRGNEIAMIFQEPMTSLNPVVSCGEQVAEVFRLHRGADRRRAAERAREMFEKVRLPDPARISRSYPHQLSGGMRQRVMIAMALACGPRLLIADEPTTALDVTIQAQILELLRDLQDTEGLSILLITHDLGVVGEMATRIEIMQAGQIVESDAASRIFRAPQHDYTRRLLRSLPGTGPLPAVATDRADEVLLQVRGLQTHFVEQRTVWGSVRSVVRAVDGVDLTLCRGETLGIVGESGSGKSTLARSILRLVEPTAGQLSFAGEDLRSLRGASLRRLRRRMQIVFQDPFASLNPRLRVGDAIAEVLRVHRVVDRAAVTPRVESLLERVGLDPRRRNQYPHEFSGGERQRLVIARALALEPEVLLCDEPVSSLDVSIQAQILALLRRLQDDLGLSYLFISHDIRVVREVSTRVAVMHAGRFVEEGSVQAVLEAPQEPYTRQLLAACPRDPRHPRTL